MLWEGQYGDFINGAQVIVDEFVVSGQAKWGLRLGLVLLLPHAWEGQGPEHSSGRLERFLEQAAEDNIARRQLHDRRRSTSTCCAARLPASAASRAPLVVMTPKSLLRHPLAVSRASDLVDGHFQPVLDDAAAARSTRAACGASCCAAATSGSSWPPTSAARRSTTWRSCASKSCTRFPSDALADAVRALQPAPREVVWLQEEPRNMGAWTFVAPRLRELLGGRDAALRRTARAAPARPKAGPTRTPPSSSASSLKSLDGGGSRSMPVEVRVPVLGESVVEATVGAG